MSDFQTEKEIWQWLLESDKNLIQWNGEEEANGGSYRVLRDGSWYYYADNMRSADRYPGSPGNRYVYLGFHNGQLWDYGWDAPCTLIIKEPTVWKKVGS